LSKGGGGTEGNPVVSPGGHNHTDDSTDDGYNGSDQEGNSCPNALPSEESDYDEHYYYEYEADSVLGFQKLFSALHRFKRTS
jgi:hypothetical protein